MGTYIWPCGATVADTFARAWKTCAEECPASAPVSRRRARHPARPQECPANTGEAYRKRRRRRGQPEGTPRRRNLASGYSCAHLAECRLFYLFAAAEFEEDFIERKRSGIGDGCSVAHEPVNKANGIAAQHILSDVPFSPDAEDCRPGCGKRRTGGGDAAETGENLVEAIFEEQTAAVQDADVIGELLDLSKLVAGDEDGAAIGSAVFDEETQKRVQGNGIEARGGFVQN